MDRVWQAASRASQTSRIDLEMSAGAPRVAEQPLQELANILATGLARVRARAAEQLYCSTGGEVRLDFSPHQSVHATVSKRSRLCRDGAQ